MPEGSGLGGLESGSSNGAGQTEHHRETEGGEEEVEEGGQGHGMRTQGQSNGG